MTIKKLMIASGNAGKLQEFNKLFAPLHIELVSLKDYDIESPEEDQNTFIGNAILKAQHASKITDLPALADDSGLYIDYLDGKPGLYSARYAHEQATDKENRDKVLAEMKEATGSQRNAHFVSVLVLTRHANDPNPLIAIGKVYGQITTQEIGDNGYGYDPIFYYPEFKKTFAELDLEEKNLISHRGKALQILKEQLAENNLFK